MSLVAVIFKKLAFKQTNKQTNNQTNKQTDSLSVLDCRIIRSYLKIFKYLLNSPIKVRQLLLFKSSSLLQSIYLIKKSKQIPRK